jgi:UDP-N-acetylmuramate--alanine ligase
LDIKGLRHIYFLGIGGIGMSALARWFNHHGYQVAGYDKTSTPLTSALQKEGIAVHFDDDIKNIPSGVVENPQNALVVYTPAIPHDLKEFNFFKDKGYELRKRSEVLGLLTKDRFTVAIAGTHGKTTTSSMTAHLLKHSGRDCSAFLGGITQNYNSNLLLSESAGKNDVVVVEADEFDRSFLRLHPNIAIITSADADHLDIYGDKEAVTSSFKDFVGKIETGGKLFIQADIAEKLLGGEKENIYVQTYGLGKGDCRAENLRIENGYFVFDYVHGGTAIKNIRLLLPGFHNVENAVGAISVGLALGLPQGKIVEALANFRGVKRRFEYIIKQEKQVFIDDYAHHPAEIEAFLKSVKALYQGKKVTALFQPHLYSRTRDFALEFALSLSLADEVWLMDIYPARELPLPGVSSEIIFKDITSEKFKCNKEVVLELVAQRKPEVLLSIGAGDIDQLIEPIKEQLEKQL